MEKIYVFGNEAAAESVKMTAYHFGIEAARIGSALIMDSEGYEEVTEKTYAPHAAVVAIIETQTWNVYPGLSMSITKAPELDATR